jgi:membrane fusion protein (multidrug efflux system)
MHAKIAAFLISGSLLLAGCSRGASSSKAAASTTVPPIAAVTAPVENRVLPRILEVTGALAADESADIASERDGQVATVRVERGTYVEKGVILATLDEREAKAQLDQARANLAWTSSEVERYAELRRKQVVAKAEDQRKGTDLDLAKAALALAEKGYADCTIRAPFAGVVTEKKISAGAYIRKGAAICGLVKIDPLRAELAIPEVAVPFIKVGQKGRLNVQSFPDRRFDAVVRYIGPSLRSEARTLVVEAIVPNPERLLKPGLFVTARVYVLGKDHVAERIVALGDRYGDAVEVRSGVAAGERVVVNPDRRLADGLEVLRSASR